MTYRDRDYDGWESDEERDAAASDSSTSSSVTPDPPARRNLDPSIGMLAVEREAGHLVTLRTDRTEIDPALVALGCIGEDWEEHDKYGLTLGGISYRLVLSSSDPRLAGQPLPWLASIRPRNPRSLTEIDDEILSTHYQVEVGAGRARCAVHDETADSISMRVTFGERNEELVSLGARVEYKETRDYYDYVDNYQHELTRPKPDERLRGPFIGWMRYRGAVVRIAAEAPDRTLIVAHPSLGAALGLEPSNGSWKQVYARWIGRDGTPVDPPAPQRAAPSDKLLDRNLRVLNPDASFVLDETPDGFLVETGLILKTDVALIGPYVRLVIFRGHLLRVAEECAGSLLVIVCARLADAFGCTRFERDGRTLGWRWFLPSELDAV